MSQLSGLSVSLSINIWPSWKTSSYIQVFPELNLTNWHFRMNFHIGGPHIQYIWWWYNHNSDISDMVMMEVGWVISICSKERLWVILSLLVKSRELRFFIESSSITITSFLALTVPPVYVNFSCLKIDIKHFEDNVVISHTCSDQIGNRWNTNDCSLDCK